MEKQEPATTLCGLRGWRPEWIQRFARKEIYVLLYSVLGAVQGMAYTYLSSVLTTIERQFGIKSQEAAWIFSGNEVSQIAFIFVLPFLTRLQKRIMWTSVALIVSAVGIFLCAMPYLVRDKAQYEGGWETQSVSTRELCGGPAGGGANTTAGARCKVQQVRDWAGLAIIFIGFFISGIGTSFFYSFGIPYIDDNVSKRNSPMALSFVLAGRTLGPALGYLLGAATLRLYVVPGLQGSLSEGEAGWLGAWWLGFIVIALVTLLLAPLLALFPERLPTQEDTEAKRLEKQQLEEPQSAMDYVKDTLSCGRRLLRNKVFVFNSLSTIFFLFGIIGFGTFVPKYFEYHFRRSTSSSGSAGGMSKALGSVVGILVSGAVLARFKFRSRVVAAWNVLIGVVGVLCFVAMSFVACPKLQIAGAGAGLGACQQSCHCSDSSFQPTCSGDGLTTFFSPCHAGCSAATERGVVVGGAAVVRRVYSDCACVVTNATAADPWWTADTQLHSPLLAAAAANTSEAEAEVEAAGEAIAGFCPLDCSRQFAVTIGLLTTFALLGSTGKVGNQLLSLRAVEPRDKAAGIIIMVSLLSLLVFLPSPIIVANIMDNSCLVWGSNCGEVTNCLLYDTDTMRHTLCYFVAVCLALATLADVGVWWNCGDIKLFDEEEEAETVDKEAVEMRNKEANK